MSPPARTRYRFGGFTLSPSRRSLRHEGREVPLIPRYLDLLLLLVEKRSVALHRQEILDRVWSDVVVSDGALSQAVRTLRRTLGESEGTPFIRTVSRHGYQFVCPVEEEEDDGRDEGELPARTGAAMVVPGERAEASGKDPLAGPLALLLDPAASDEARRDAAEELHGLGTAEALVRLDRRPGHARAWAYLRDSRWDVAGAGEVPLLSAPAGPAAWAALAALRLRQALRLAGARWAGASLGGAMAGALAGILGGLAMAALGGSAAHRAGASLLDALFGLGRPAIGGGFEGLCLGAAAGVGFGLATRRLEGGVAAPRGRSRLRAVAAIAVACALGGGLVAAAGGHLGAVSLDAIVDGFPSTRVELGRLGRPFGEEGLGPRTRVALGLGEGLLFGAGLAAGLTRRPRRRDED